MFEDMMAMYEKGKQELSNIWEAIDSVKVAAQASDAIKRAAGTPENANMFDAIEKSRQGVGPVVLAPAPPVAPQPVTEELDLFKDTTSDNSVIPAEEAPVLAPQGTTPEPVVEVEAVKQATDDRGTENPRGIRNNNPLNIEQGDNAWDGLSDDQSADVRFAVFDTAEEGIRAAARTLSTYQNKHGLKTVHDMISRWSPIKDKGNVDASGKENTTSYINNVSKAVGVSKNSMVKIGNNTKTKAMLKAMIKQENGSKVAGHYSDAVFEEALELAFPK